MSVVRLLCVVVIICVAVSPPTPSSLFHLYASSWPSRRSFQPPTLHSHPHQPTTTHSPTHSHIHTPHIHTPIASLQMISLTRVVFNVCAWSRFFVWLVDCVMVFVIVRADIIHIIETAGWKCAHGPGGYRTVCQRENGTFMLTSSYSA